MDPTNANTALASALAEELARCGINQAVVCPGSRSTPLALALDNERHIRTTIVIDERSAGFIALGMGAATGRPAVVLTTSGTAVANLAPAVSEAAESGVPLIALSADRPPELRGIGAGQTIDQIKAFGDTVRWFCEVGAHDADDAGLLHYRSVACRAVTAATDPARPGPVHLNLAWREPLSPVSDPTSTVSAESELARHGRGPEQPLSGVTMRSAAPPADVVAALAARLRRAPRGIVVAGRQRDRALAGHLARLSELTGYPVLAEPTSQARSNAAGEALVAGYEWIARYRPRALEPELIIRFGEFPTSKALRGWLGNNPNCEQIAVLESGWNDPATGADTVVRAEAAATAAALADSLAESEGPPTDDEWRTSWLRAGSAVEQAIRATLSANGGAPAEPALHRALARHYGDGDVVYTASSMPIRDQEAFLPTLATAPQFLANRGANGIDGLVSSAIGAAVAAGRPVWAITGDLGFLHDSNALLSLGRSATPVRVVVVNNDGGAIFEHLPQSGALDREQFERLFITPAGVDLVALCAAHGVDYVRLDSIDDLNRLDEEVPGSCVIELLTDGRADVALRGKVAEATRDALVDALSIT